MNSDCPTVFIVDDDASVLKSISRIIRLAGLHASTHSSAEDFLATVPLHPVGPCCLILDLTMPGMGGLELQSRMQTAGIICPIVFMSGNGSIPVTVQAMKQGAVTFLSKPFDQDSLLQSISEALELHGSRSRESHKVSDIQNRINELSGRERQVMGGVISGMLNKQIASELGIVEKTVKVHRARVMEKMRATSVADLVRLCDAIGFDPTAP